MNNKKGMNGVKAALGNLLASYWFYLFFAFAVIGLSVSAVVPAIVDASVWTDKADYAPDETVIINGSGFNSSATINLTINLPDGSIFIAGPQPTADAYGDFQYSYPLTAAPAGTYAVSASDGINSALTAFTLNSFSISCNGGEGCPSPTPTITPIPPLCIDADGDGYNSTDAQCGVIDCNDNDNTVFPGAAETCNDIDDNCNQATDEDLTQACGGGSCAGVSTCQAGVWGACSTQGNSCDICGSCDATGTCSVYDPGNVAGCSQYNVGAINTCDYNPDGITVTLDTSDPFTSQCSGLNECSQFDPNTIQHAYDLSCGAECTPEFQGACDPKLEGEYCLNGGSCGDFGTCAYGIQNYCPSPGTTTDGICYWGSQTCDGEGCGLNENPVLCPSGVGNQSCSATLGPQDSSGPLVTTVVAYPDPTNQKINVKAVLTDTCTMINYSEFYFDECGAPGTGTPIYPTDDGVFNGDKNQENVSKLNILLAAYGITDGRHTVFVRAQNTQGVWGACGFDVFEVDLLPPEIVRNVTFGLPQLVCGLNPTLSVEFCDTQSPINQAEYFLDGNWSILPNGAGLYMSATDGNFDELCEFTNATINLSTLDDGKHCVKFHAKDLAGNWGKMTFIDEICFIVDRTPPTTIKTVGEPKIVCEESPEQGVTECWYVNQSTEISMESQDFIPEDGYYSNDVATLYRVRYKYDFNDSWGPWGVWTPYTGPFSFPEDSMHEVEYYSYDSCMNNETSQFEIDIVDTKYPITTKTVGEPKVACAQDDPNECDWYITQHTPIDLRCVDQQPHPSDDVTLYYRYNINGGQWNGWYEYEGTIYFEEDSRHTLEYYCVDALGNQEPVQTEVDVVDTQAPDLEKMIGEPKVVIEGSPGDPDPEGPIDVLLIRANGDNYLSDVISKLQAFPELGTIDDFDARSATPSLALLQDYDAVLVWSNYYYDDPVALGNVLADYADSGGGVTLMTFSWYDGFRLDGRYMTDGYGAIVYGDYDPYSSGSMGTVFEPSHQVMSGVSSFSTGDFRSGTSLVNPGAVKIVDYDDGQVLAAVNEFDGHRACDLGFFPPSSDINSGSWDSSTDGAELMRNCLLWTAGANGSGVESQTFITQNTTISLWCTDGQPHPVDNVSISYRSRFRFDENSDWGNWTDWTIFYGEHTDFTFQEDSIHELEYYCADALGNQVKNQFETDIVDTKPPISEKFVGEPKVACEDVGDEDCDWYITQQTPINFRCTDQDPHPVDDVKVNFRYKINDGEYTDWMIYNGSSFYFPQDSRHTLQYFCEDALGNKEEVKTEVDVVDTQAPNTTKVVGDPKHACETQEECDWYITQQTPITLECEDGDPHPVGGEQITYYYCVWDGENEECTDETQYEGPFMFPQDSWHTLNYWCTDALENREETQTEYDIVDTQKPEITKEVGEPSIPCADVGDESCHYYITQDTQISLSCTDGDPHPVDHVQVGYRTRFKEDFGGDWGEWTDWNLFNQEHVDFNFTEDSIHEVEYYCQDILGNRNGSLFEIDIVDTQGPTVDKEVGEPKVSCQEVGDPSCDWYITQNTPITLSCTDGQPHPVEGTTTYFRYMIDDGEFSEWFLYEGSFYYPEDSRHTLEYKCVDALGNSGPVYTEVDVVDTQAPETEKTVGDPKHECENIEECDWYITQNTPISLSCTDRDPHPVGGEQITYYYCVWDGENEECTDETQYEGPFMFPQDSWHTLNYWCTDALENREETQTEYDIVDTQKPEITKEVGEPSIPCADVGDESCHYYITQDTQISLSCTDGDPHPVDHVSLSYRWRLDGGEWTQWFVGNESAIIQFQEDSVHEIEYSCADALGNSVNYTEIDRVDSTPPNTTKTVLGNSTACTVGDECDFYVCKDTRLNWNSTDGGLICHVDGVKTYYRYLLDGYEWSEWFDFGESGDFYFENKDEGIYLFEFYSEDALGNAEESQFEIDIFDKQKPKGWILNPVSGRYYHDGEQFSVYAPAYDLGNPASGIASCTFYAIDIHFEELEDDELAQVMWYIKNYNTLDDLMAFLGPERYTLVPLGSVPYESGVCKGVVQIPEDSGLTDKAYLVIEISDKSCNTYYDLARDSSKDAILMDIDNTPPFVELTDLEGLPGPLSEGDYFVAYLEATDYDSALFQCSGEIVQNECTVVGEGEGEVQDPIFTPTSVEAWLHPGESVEEQKVVTTEETPITKVDVMFSLDLTGSMGGELSTVKSSSISIMNDISSLVADSQFGANSFMDYPFSYFNEVTNCGYNATYGSAGNGDYAYNLDQDITSSTGDVSSAINGLSLGFGNDGPEAYSRALYESQFASWRSGSKKILVMFGDNVPHDCEFNGDTTGKDPGRDNAVNTADDLDFEDVVAQLGAADIAVISVDSGSDHAPWQYMATQTRGQWFDLDDVDDIPGAIVSLIEEETSTIDEVTVDVQPGFEDWVSWVPFSYTNVTGNQTLQFNLTFDVPLGTLPGDYVFWIRIVGDGSTLREQIITIHVPGVCEESEERHFDFDGEILSDHSCKVYGNVPEELEDGSHTLVLSAMDFEYNSGSVETTLMVDNHGPDKEIISPLAGEVYSELIPIELVALDLSGVNPNTVQYRIFENVASLFGTPIGSEEYDSGWRLLPHVSGDTFGTDFNTTFEGLEDGKTYYMRARACDTLFSGTLPNGAEIPEHCSDPEVTFKIDKTAPTAPGSATISSCVVSWSASTDASGVESYRVFHDGVYVASTTSLSYLGVCADGTWSVSAVDVAGNEGSQSVASAPAPPSTPPSGGTGSSGNSGNSVSGSSPVGVAPVAVPKVTDTASPNDEAANTPSENQVSIEQVDETPIVAPGAAIESEVSGYNFDASDVLEPTTGFFSGSSAPYLGGAIVAFGLLLFLFARRKKRNN